MTFSKFDAHSSPLFKELKIIKFLDLVSLHMTIFMHKFHNNNLPLAFNRWFSCDITIYKAAILVYQISRQNEARKQIYKDYFNIDTVL